MIPNISLNYFSGSIFNIKRNFQAWVNTLSGPYREGKGYSIDPHEKRVYYSCDSTKSLCRTGPDFTPSSEIYVNIINPTSDPYIEDTTAAPRK
jgi:hypothetical protein